MRATVAVLVTVGFVGMATSAAAQAVVTYPAGVPVTTYYAPGPAVVTYPPPVTTYYVPSVPVTTYYAPAVTTVYRPRYIVRPKVYVRGQPIRNVLRAITP